MNKSRFSCNHVIIQSIHCHEDALLALWALLQCISYRSIATNITDSRPILSPLIEPHYIYEHKCTSSDLMATDGIHSAFWRLNILIFRRLSHYVRESKNVRQLVTAERQLPPKCTNFGFFTTKMYEFWVFYHQSVRILVFFKEMYEYWGVSRRP